MSSRFDRAYRVSGSTNVDADFWNRIMRDIDTRLVAVEEKKADFEEAEKTLLDLGLRRINETLLPAAQRIQAVSEMGFLIASSDDELAVAVGQTVSLTIREGAQRDLFTPSPFVALTRRSTVEDYAIARVVTYNRDTGILVVQIESVTGNPGPHNDWDVVALAGAVMAQMATLDETKALRAEVANDKAAVALDKAAAQSARTEAQAARDAAIIAKTGAESALASFMQVYRGALPSAPPDGEQGHFYFDTTLQMALVYTATGWAPLFQVALGGIRQGFLTATAGQTEIDVGGNFTFINVWRNGVLLTAGVDYTTASPKIILTTPAASGDEIAYTGYHSTDASDFYTKMAADNRFVRKDSTTVERMSGPLEVRRLLTLRANETGNVDVAIVNNEGNEVGSIIATPSTGYLAIRRRKAGGTHDVLAFLSDGRLTYNGQRLITEAEIDPWAMQPIGVPIPVLDHISGVTPPPTNKSYRYVKMSAGETGAGGYNEGILTNETVSGSAPLISAIATINLPASPMHGKAFRLINTERRFIRPGPSGEIQDDAFQSHLHGPPPGVAGYVTWQSNSLGSSGAVVMGVHSNTGGPVEHSGYGVPRVSTETRPRNIGATYYMRIL